jgi:hypothetical protein
MTGTSAQASAAQALTAVLRERGYRAEVFPADPPNTLVDAVNVWYDAADRYPAASVWAPLEDDSWDWGDDFEHSVAAGTPIPELADQILRVLRPRD